MLLGFIVGGVAMSKTDVAAENSESYFVRGASVRLVDEKRPAAIKFHVVMTLEEFDVYGSINGDTLKLDGGYTTATLVTPYEQLNGEELTVASNAYLIDTTSKWKKVNVEGVDYAESIVYFYNVKEDEYGTELAVRGVVCKDGEPVEYTAQVNDISLSFVAKAELNDENTALSQEQLQALYEEYIRKEVRIVVDGVAQTQYVDYMDTMDEVTVPAKQEDGDEFVGFFTQENEPFLFSEPVKNHTTIYARYRESIVLGEETPSFAIDNYKRQANDIVKSITFTSASGNSYKLGSDPTNLTLGTDFQALKGTYADYGEGIITVVLNGGVADYTLTLPALVVTAKISTGSQLKDVLTYKTSNPYFDAQTKAVFGYFRLTEDISMSDWSNNNYKTEGGITHADKTQGFRAILDGASHTISGNYTGNYGLFASIGEGACIKDVKFSLKAYYNIANGTIFGSYIQGATFENVEITTQATQRYSATASESTKYTNIGYLSTNGASGCTFKNVTITTNGDVHTLFGGYALMGYEQADIGQNTFDGVCITATTIDYIGFKNVNNSAVGVTMEEEVCNSAGITYNGQTIDDFLKNEVFTENQDIVLGGVNAEKKQRLNIGASSGFEIEKITYYAASGNEYDLGVDTSLLTIPDALRTNVKDHGVGKVIVITKWDTTIEIPVTIVTCEITALDLDENASGPFMYSPNNPYFDIETMTIDGYFTLASDMSIWNTPNNSSSSSVTFNYDDVDAGFIGIFDGRGYTINHTSSGQWGAASTRGLFGQLGTGALVKDVTIVMSTYTHTQYSAVFATSAYNTVFENVTVTMKQGGVSGYDTAQFYLTGFLTAHSISGCIFNGVTVELNGQRIKSLFGGRSANGYEEDFASGNKLFPGQNIYNDLVINGVVDYMGTGHDVNLRECNFTVEEEILAGGNITYNGKGFADYLPTTNYLLAKDDEGVWYSDYTIIYDDTNESLARIVNFMRDQIQRATGGVVYASAGDGTFDEVVGGYTLRKAVDGKWDENARYIVIGNEEMLDKAGVAFPITEGCDYTMQWKGNSLFLFASNEDDYISVVLRFLEETIGYKGLSDDYVVYDDFTYVDLKTKIPQTIDCDVAYSLRGETNGIRAGKYDVKGINGTLSGTWKVWPDIPESVSSRYGGSYYAPHHNSVCWVPKEAATVGDDLANWFTGLRSDNNAYDLCYTAHGNQQSYQRMVATAANHIYAKLLEAGASASNNVNVAFGIMDDYSVDMCQCDTCRGFYDQNNGAGMDTALLLNFLTDVINAIEAKSPTMQFTLYTLAYHCYEAPPTTAQLIAAGIEDGKLSNRLGVIYAPSLGSDRTYRMASAQSIYNEENDQARANMKTWAGLVQHAGVWLYDTYYYNYMMPFDSFSSMLTWLEYAARVFSDNHLYWVFVNGQPSNRMTTAFEAFKSYTVQKAEIEILDKVKTNVINDGRNSANYATYQAEIEAYLLELESEFFGFTVGVDGVSKNFNDKGYYGPAAANKAMYEFYKQMREDYQAMLGNKRAMTYDAETRSVSNQPLMFGYTSERYDYMTYKRNGVTYYAKYNIWLTNGRDTDAHFANWEKATVNFYMEKLETAMAAVEAMADVGGVKAVYKQHVLLESLFPRFVICNGNHKDYWASGYNHTGASYWSGNLTAARTAFKDDCASLGMTSYRESSGGLTQVYTRWGISA